MNEPKVEETKREVRKLSDIDLPLPDSTKTKIKRLGDKIAELSALLSDYENIKKTYISQLADLAHDNGIDYSLRSDTWTYEEVSGRLYLSEQLLLEEGIPMSVISKCKIRSEPYRQVRRDREKRERV